MLLDSAPFQANLHRNELAKYWSDMVEPESWEYCRVRYNRSNQAMVYFSKKSSTTRMAVYRVHSHVLAWCGLQKKDGAARYVTKYATKAEQKRIPEDYKNMGRFWGAPHHLSIKKLIKTWVYIDDDGAIELALKMRPDMASWTYLPKIVLGNTDDILTMLSDSV